jgi:hypothetical protein
MADAFPPADIVAAMNDPATFGGWFSGASWAGWRSVLKAAFALPMTERDVEFFRAVAERDPPRRRVRELWIVAGRGAGKDSISSLIAGHAAALFDRPSPKGTLARIVSALRGGERALVMCLAVDREQAGIALDYTRDYFSKMPALRAMITRETKYGFELSNKVEVAVATNSFRSIRGRSILMCILDEVAFWKDEKSSTPDEEVYTAVLPGLARVPESMLIGISSPYRKAGILYRKFTEHYGRDGDDVLVIRAPSLTMNPTLDRDTVARAIAQDPAKGKAEWNAEFRDDISDLIPADVIEAATDWGVPERPPRPGNDYLAFCDASGGTGQDSFALAIAHVDDLSESIVLDLIRERKPRFVAAEVIREFSDILRSYNVASVTGDSFGGGFTSDEWARAGIQFTPSRTTTAENYLRALPLLTSKRGRLLDHATLRTQLSGLERRVVAGRETVDHARGAHDDVATAVCGAFVLGAGSERRYVKYTCLGTNSEGMITDGKYVPATSVGKPTVEEYQEYYSLSPQDQSRRDFLGPNWRSRIPPTDPSYRAKETAS